MFMNWVYIFNNYCSAYCLVFCWEMTLLGTWLGAEEMGENEAHTVALFDTFFLFAFVPLLQNLTLCSSVLFNFRNEYIDKDRPMHTQWRKEIQYQKKQRESKKANKKETRAWDGVREGRMKRGRKKKGGGERHSSLCRDDHRSHSDKCCFIFGISSENTKLNSKDNELWPGTSHLWNTQNNLISARQKPTFDPGV